MPGPASLVAGQNVDGGWPYRNGSSSTEPTVLALLALLAAGELSPAIGNRARTWLMGAQRADGGWPPRTNVDLSTWVTSLVLLLPTDMLGRSRDRGLQWLSSRAGRETSWFERTREALIRGKVSEKRGEGWPWFPETAAWVTPTCFGLLAAEKAIRSRPDQMWNERIAAAREYLLKHRCRDGGWNHGSTAALGYESDSYPETTGQALLAIHGERRDTTISLSLDRARAHLKSCRSLEASGWLRLGLIAHGEKMVDTQRVQGHGHGTIPEIAIAAIAGAAAAGRNVFLQDV